MTADDSEVRVEVAVLDQGGFCGFCRAWIASGGLGDTGADGGARVLLWNCCRRGTERRLGRRQWGCRCVRLEEARS